MGYPLSIPRAVTPFVIIAIVINGILAVFQLLAKERVRCFLFFKVIGKLGVVPLYCIIIVLQRLILGL